MARTRSIKPEFFDDEKLASVSRDSRLLFIGLWKCSDDFGVTRGHESWLRSQIFPYDDDLNAENMQKMIDDLEAIKCIVPFTHNDEKYYHIRKFSTYQKVDKPSKMRNPEPPADHVSRDSRETLARLSENPIDETETETETETVVKGLSVDKPADAARSKKKHFSKKIEKYLQEIKKHCEMIRGLPSKNGGGFNPYMWVQKATNDSGHPEAIRDTLKNMIGAWPGVNSPDGWWRTVFEKYNAKYNEREAIRMSEQFKAGWSSSPEIKELIETIGEE